MKKVPNLSPKNLLEVKRKKQEHGISFAKIKREYGISYNDILKILRFFPKCEFEVDIIKRLEEIKIENKEKADRDYKKNYLKYREYYLQYSREQYERKKLT